PPATYAPSLHDALPIYGTTTSFPAATTTAIVGMNGSGKTTLVSLIAGRLTSAQFRMHQPVDVVLLTQNPGLPKTASVEQTISMVTKNATVTHELLHAAGLTPLRHVRVSTLSNGQAAQVALVRALAAKPKALVL